MNQHIAGYARNKYAPGQPTPDAEYSISNISDIVIDSVNDAEAAPITIIRNGKANSHRNRIPDFLNPPVSVKRITYRVQPLRA